MLQDVLGCRTGGEPTMLTMDGTTTQKPEKMTSYTLEDGSDILGPPKDEYVQVLRNMIRGKVRRSK